MKKLIDQFNLLFEGRAKAIINGDRLEITIGNTTLIISLPEVIGGQGVNSEDTLE